MLDVDDLELFFAELFAYLVLLFDLRELRLELLYLLDRLSVFDPFVHLFLEQFDLRTEAVERDPSITLSLLLHLSPRLRPAQTPLGWFVGPVIEAYFSHRLGELEGFLLVTIHDLGFLGLFAGF